MLAAGTSSAIAASPETPVNLASAGDFTILSKTGITDVFKTTVDGNVGTSPITGAALLLSCAEVNGIIYTVDAAGPLPCRVTDATRLTAAVGDMEAAYNDAAGRTLPDALNLGAGEIGGLTLTPGLYKWTTDLSISKDVTLAGGPNDVFILQVAGTITEANAKQVILSGGAQAKNVYWASAGAVAIGTNAHFEGTILSKTMIAMNTNASINGRLLAQTAVTLQMNTITPPASGLSLRGGVLRGEVQADRVHDARVAVPEVVHGAHDSKLPAGDAVRDQAGTLGEQMQRMPDMLRLDLVRRRHAGLVRSQDAGGDPFDDVADVPPR